MAGSDQHRVADRVGDEVHAAQQERAQEYLPDRGVGLHNTAKIRPADFYERAVFAGPASDQTAPSRELVHFAGKHSAAEHKEDGTGTGPTANPLYAAVADYKDAVNIVSLVEEDFTR